MRTSFPRCARSGRSAMEKSSKSSMRERLRAATVGKMPARKWSEAGSFSKISKTWSGGGSGVGPGVGSALGLESGATVRMRVRSRDISRTSSTRLAASYISLYLPMSPYVSLYLTISHGPRARAWPPPISPYISLCLPISPYIARTSSTRLAASYISLYLPMSPYISLHLTDLEHALGNLLAALVHAAPAVLGRGLSQREEG